MADPDVHQSRITWTEFTVGGVPTVVLKCSGDIDQSNAYMLAASMTDALRSSTGDEREAGAGAIRRLVVDLTDITYAGAGVVDALVYGARELRAGAAPTVGLVIDSKRIVETALHATELRDIFRLYQDVDCATVGGPEL